MKKSDVTELSKKTDSDLSSIMTISIHEYENLISQRNDTLSRIDIHEKDKLVLNKLIIEAQDQLSKQAATYEQRISGLQSLIDSMGGTEQGIKVMKDIKKQKLLKDREYINSQLTELES